MNEKAVPDTEVKIFRLKDRPELAAVCAHWAYGQWYMKRTVPFDLVLKAYRQWAAGTGLPEIFVAVNKTYPVGMAALKERDLWARKDLRLWLSSVYVMPQFRKKGIGEKLITAVTSEAENQDINLYLFLDPENERDLIPFYEKRGWLFSENAPDNDGQPSKIYRFPLTGHRIFSET